MLIAKGLMLMIAAARRQKVLYPDQGSADPGRDPPAELCKADHPTMYSVSDLRHDVGLHSKFQKSSSDKTIKRNLIKLNPDAPSIILYVTPQKKLIPKRKCSKNTNATESPHFRHQKRKKKVVHSRKVEYLKAAQHH